MPFFCPPDKHPHAGRDLVRLPREEGLLLGHCWDGEVQEGRHVERRAQPHAHHINLEVVHMAILYRADGICWVKGSVCFVLKFAFPPISPPPLLATTIDHLLQHLWGPQVPHMLQVQGWSIVLAAQSHY